LPITLFKSSSRTMTKIITVLCPIVCASCYVSSGPRDDGGEGDNGGEPAPETYDRIEIGEEYSPGDPPADLRVDPPVDAPGEETGGITAEEYCWRMYMARCGYFSRCCTEDELQALSDTRAMNCRSPSDDVDYEFCMESLMTDIHEGIYAIDEDSLDACESLWLELSGSCRNYGITLRLRMGSVCEKVLRGTLGEGVSCGDSNECMDGLFCHHWDDVCAPKMGWGGVCRVNEGCSEGLICYDFHCIDTGYEGSICDDDRDCTSPFWCDEGTGTCTNLLPAGERCEDAALWGCEGLCRYPERLCEDFCDGL
jgi:hypothetical protein